MTNTNKPTHVGTILKEDYLAPMGMSPSDLALKMRLPEGRVMAILNGREKLKILTATKLASALGHHTGYWMDIQKRYDAWAAESSEELPQIGVSQEPDLALSRVSMAELSRETEKVIKATQGGASRLSTMVKLWPICYQCVSTRN
ncbi:HigA family addiction module antitoxin [Dongshaea marina]|uniref:HigA family addiction module antitoxin n=1 Tax=Dongshaea marina TaxID=2047966 RepID=UPI000D3EBBA0|nr:HigA family addiction module antitoxin [Dongshaea marina]